MLWSTTERAASLLRPRSLILSGGVAANSRLKQFLAEKCAGVGLRLHYPRPVFTTDNAAMIAAAGSAKFMRGETVDMTANADPNMRLAVPERDFPDKRWRT
jgi:N6-L-threonylcarbamoyladenine synthase